MKTKNVIFTLLAAIFAGGLFAQDRTTVTATSNDISDNLDLRAVASIFGDSRDLADFERRLNDPKVQISNLDLNGDRAVDYLRVIESIEGNAHLIIVQAVLDRDVYQDVATIQVERDNNNVVQVHVVGDTYMYGQNYVYQPVYVTRPLIYDTFWMAGYSPYWSNWYYNYYPTYYYTWAPCPVFRYRTHIHNHINVYNTYTYVNTSPRYYASAPRYRGNGYELLHPGRSFRERNGVRNNYELNSIRNTGTRTTQTANADTGVRNFSGTRTNSTAVESPRTGTRNLTGTRSNTIGTSVVENPRAAAPRTGTRTETTSPRSVTVGDQTNSFDSPRTGTRTQSVSPRATPSTSYESTHSGTRTVTPSTREASTRTEPATYSAPRTASPRMDNASPAPSSSPRVQSNTRSESPRVSAPQSSTRVSSPGPSYGSGSTNTSTRGASRR